MDKVSAQRHRSSAMTLRKGTIIENASRRRLSIRQPERVAQLQARVAIFATLSAAPGGGVYRRAVPVVLKPGFLVAERFPAAQICM